MGLFLHSTSAPELVVEVMAHAGLSISLTAIHNMVNSLSTCASERLRELAKSRTMAFAYDNFDMDFKSYSPTVGKPGATLLHATSALAFPLAHGVTADDLKCSQQLWDTDPMNPNASLDTIRPTRTWWDCVMAEEPSREERIYAWHFRDALVKHGGGFEHFRSELGSPEAIMRIPVTKTTHIPCRAMDINQSTNDGQGQIFKDLFAQANIGDPTDFSGAVDIREHVVLVHGDLGAGERINGIKQSRSIETKEVRRLQPVVFSMGLFHLLMAIRPHDSGRIGSKPGFRLMHELIKQFALARMLEVWRVEVHKCNSAHTSLALFADSKPTWQDVVNLSLRIAKDYLSVPAMATSDKLLRNNKIILARLLLYVETADAMKYGDIGRVEATFLPWASIHKTVSKHKYSAWLIKTRNDLMYVYPERLARAIRLNWLCNPSGKQDGFRPVDWMVELLNLYTKVVYPGTGYTRTLQLVLKQSPLIELFRHVHRLMQDNFHLIHRTVRHAPPDIGNTIKVLCKLLQESKGYTFVKDRKSVRIPDHLHEGMLLLQTQSGIVRVTRPSNTEELPDASASESAEASAHAAAQESEVGVNPTSLEGVQDTDGLMFEEESLNDVFELNVD
ncbi:hypothetical protein K474DRAFT_1678964 [Panus rudis PR-1116 ss-1]|nr:hypothetical protein K474DRAFT_1678964 [Panus rudis PR-1116 ss-1]